jgi:Leucine Rich repeat
VYAMSLALRTSAHVHSLTLFNCGLSAKALAELALALAGTSLTSLAVESNHSLHEEEEAVAAAAAAAQAQKDQASETQPAQPPPQPPATSELPAPAAPSSSAESWAWLAARWSPLTRLSLRCNNMDARDCAGLGASLALNTCLLELDLSHNRLGEEGLASLCKGLAVNTSLQHLALSQTSLTGGEGCAALLTLLQHRPVEDASAAGSARVTWEAELAAAAIHTAGSLVAQGVLSEARALSLGLTPPVTPSPVKGGKAAKPSAAAAADAAAATPRLGFPSARSGASLVSLDLSGNRLSRDFVLELLSTLKTAAFSAPEAEAAPVYSLAQLSLFQTAEKDEAVQAMLADIVHPSILM